MMQLPAAAQGVVQKNEVAFKKDVGAKEITYRRLEKFQAEEVTKLEGQDIWIALRTLD